MQKKTKTTMIAILVILVLFVVAMIVYLRIELSSIHPTIPVAVKTGPPSLGADVSSQDLLFYGNLSTVVPYLLLDYSSRNVSSLYVYAALYKTPIPSNVYILNTTNECIGCGNIALFISDLATGLYHYGVIANQSSLVGVSLQNVTGIQNDSVLVVPNGLLPGVFLQPYENTNMTVIDYLLSKGTSIVYIGRNFSNVLLQGSVITPVYSLPTFLKTSQYSGKIQPGTIPNSTFYFSAPTFSFLNGHPYYNSTYENVGSGSIVAFSNYLNSWSSASDSASDVSRAIASLFWLPYYSSGYERIPVPTSYYAFSTGSSGLLLETPMISYGGSMLSQLDSSYGRLAVYTNSSFSDTSNSFFYYSNFEPSFAINGTLSLPGVITPNSNINVQMQIFTNSSSPVSIEPHLTIYNLYGESVLSIPLPPLSASGNFTFIKYMSIPLGPGSYVASLQGLSNKRYGDALVYVPPLTISPVVKNFSSGTFTFSISDSGVPISGINYTINANKLYPESGVVSNGTIVYTLPRGSPQMFGSVNFSIGMFSENFTYSLYNPPQVLKINKQYVELAVVAIIVFLMLVLVRAPNRDEFYIDVPMLPPQAKTQIKLQSKELLGAFDKLNMYYHWKFMPLSKKEIKSAIANYIRFGNVPVNLTYNNIDMILSKLQANKLLIERDGLYMPAYWVEQSGHDPDYLATFKKLRTFFVSNTFIFSDLDASNLADMVATIRGDRVYIVIYSDSSKFRKITLYPDVSMFVAFLNSDKLDEFRSKIYSSTSREAEELKMYLSSGFIKLIDADNPGEQIT